MEQPLQNAELEGHTPLGVERSEGRCIGGPGNGKGIRSGGQVESVSRRRSPEALAWLCAAVAGSQDVAGENGP